VTLQRSSDSSFLIGLATGVMAGLWTALWLVPHVVSDLRRRRDDVADSVVRGAQEVERIASAAKTDTIGE
jgi:gas vesicle protein